MSAAPHRLTPAQSGVYRTPVHVDAVRHSLAKDALWLDLDFAHVGNKSELMHAFATTGLPDYFGGNWDALSDVLTDLSWHDAPAYVLRLTNAAPAARALGSDWAILIEVLRHAADYWKAEARPFVVFVDDGAELSSWI
jgi:RNAse (barnase) inhibitor barstar